MTVMGPVATRTESSAGESDPLDSVATAEHFAGERAARSRLDRWIGVSKEEAGDDLTYFACG